MKKVLFVLAVCFIFFSGSIVFANTEEEAQMIPAYYQMVEIEKGDTVWEIARAYLPQKRTTKDFVKEIFRVNQMISAKILPGQMIIIPIYSQE